MWHLQCSRLRTPHGTHGPRLSGSPPSLQRLHYSRVSDVYRVAQRSNENSKESNALKHEFIALSLILDEFWSWFRIFLRSYELVMNFRRLNLFLKMEKAELILG